MIRGRLLLGAALLAAAVPAHAVTASALDALWGGAILLLNEIDDRLLAIGGLILAFSCLVFGINWIKGVFEDRGEIDLDEYNHMGPTHTFISNINARHHRVNMSRNYRDRTNGEGWGPGGDWDDNPF